eukprot:3330510-Amphidinium_carterae.2
MHGADATRSYELFADSVIVQSASLDKEASERKRQIESKRKQEEEEAAKQEEEKRLVKQRQAAPATVCDVSLSPRNPQIPIIPIQWIVSSRLVHKAPSGSCLVWRHSRRGM